MTTISKDGPTPHEAHSRGGCGSGPRQADAAARHSAHETAGCRSAHGTRRGDVLEQGHAPADAGSSAPDARGCCGGGHPAAANDADRPAHAHDR